jgi:hypothetical protein
MKTNIKLKSIFFILTTCLLLANISCERNDVFSPDLALNNDTIRISRDSITSNVIVFSNTNWTVELEDPEATPWLSLSPNEQLNNYSGSGQSYFQFTAKKNGNSSIRYGTFIITTVNSKKTLVIRQNS